MFETISGSRIRRPAAGTAVSIALHLAVIGAAVWFTARHVKGPPQIDFIPLPAPPPRGAPPPPPGRSETPRPPRSRLHPKRADLVQPTAPEPTKTPEPALEEEAEGDEIPGEPEGVPGGVPVGVPGGQGSSFDVVQGPLAFEEGRMTPPRRLSGPDPEYTVPALEHEIEGVMSVRCVVTEQGAVHGCRVLRSLPYMDAAVMRALEQRRYAPATIGGRPVAVDYLFQIRLRLP